jgi:hypothetical protein
LQQLTALQSFLKPGGCLKKEEKMKKIFTSSVLLGFALFFLNGADKAPGERIVQLPELTKPSKIKACGDGIFVVNNRYNILIYSLQDFKLKGQFGGRGEGPGEFKFTIKLSIMPNFVLIDSQDRLSWFSKEGKFLKQKNKRTGISYIPSKNKFIGESFKHLPNQMNKIEYGIYDSDLKKIKILDQYMFKLPLIGADGIWKVKEWKMIRHYHNISSDFTSGKIFIADSEKGFFYYSI